VGGVPIVLAFAGAFGILLLIDSPRVTSLLRAAQTWEVIGAAALMFAVGLLDDFFSLKPWQKLSGEIAAAALMFQGGVQIHTLGSFAVPQILWGVLTVIWLVGCTNAFNLIDGADGLAGGLGLIASIAVLAVGIVHHDAFLMLAAATLAGGLIGFLRFNFHPASIFLGDCGSLFVGFLIAACGVVWSQKQVTALAVTAPAMAFAVPLFDTGISILRRFLRRQPIFSGDRDHIHHRLLDRGFTTPRLVALLYCVAAALAGFALIESTAGPLGRAAILATFVVGLYVAIQYLRYREFGLAASALRDNGVRAAVRSHLALGRCEDALQGAQNADQCWEAVLRASRELGFYDVAMRMHGRNYREGSSAQPGSCWALHVPLGGADYLRFLCPFGSARTPAIIAPLADSLHGLLTAKSAQLPPEPDEFRTRAARFIEKRRLRTKAIAAMAAGADRAETESLAQRKMT